MRLDLIKSFDRAAALPLALSHWDFAENSIEHVRDGENFVYRFRVPGAGNVRYLRITHESRRNIEQLLGEIEFVNYLKDHEIKLAAPVQSRAGNWVETIDLPPQKYFATVFEAVPGEPVQWGKDQENRAFLFQRGKALGRLHKVSCTWRARLPNRRHHWYEDDLFTDPSKLLHVEDVIPRREYEEVLKWMLARKRSTENYGLVHGDFGTGNVRHVNGEVVCFDFDDCSYHWFTYDLGVAMRAARRLPFKYRKAYLRVLMDGYETEKSLCGDTEREVAQFCRVAALYRFVTVLRQCDREQFTPELKSLFESRLKVLADPPAWY